MPLLLLVQIPYSRPSHRLVVLAGLEIISLPQRAVQAVQAVAGEVLAGEHLAVLEIRHQHRPHKVTTAAQQELTAVGNPRKAAAAVRGLLGLLVLDITREQGVMAQHQILVVRQLRVAVGVVVTTLR